MKRGTRAGAAWATPADADAGREYDADDTDNE